MEKEKRAKKKKWIKRRHRIVTELLRVFLTPYIRLKYKIKVERFAEQEKRAYLVLLNHQTPFDQFFVGMAFRRQIYYLATEDIFSNGWISSLIKYLVAPIPIQKQTMDVKAVMTCLRVAREGGTIAIAPEGNRTYSGRTEYMSPSIASLAKKMKLPIVLFRIEGGYGTEPRWSDVVRKGTMRGYVARVISPEEYNSMTDDELFEIIREGLYVNEAVADRAFYHKRSAEYLERLVYVCPYCGLSEFESRGDLVRCKKCDRQIRYLPQKELEGVGFEFPYHFVADWYDAQKDYINTLDLTETEEALYCEEVCLSEVIPYQKKQVISENATLTLFGNRLLLAWDETQMPFDFSDCSAVTVLGRNKLNLYVGNQIYQIKGSKRFNALKYVHIYHRHKNIVKGEADAKFLGL